MSCDEIVKKYVGYIDVLKEIDEHGVTDLSVIDVMHMDDSVNVKSADGEVVVGQCTTNDKNFSFHISPSYIDFSYDDHQHDNYETKYLYEQLSLQCIGDIVSISYRLGGFEISEEAVTERKIGPQISIDKEFLVSDQFDLITGISELYTKTCQIPRRPIVLEKTM